jgi:N-acetyl sugar amidotransferase
MDTTDPEITFDGNGICNHCHHFDKYVSLNWFPNEEGRRRLETIVEQIKREGTGKEYDCIIGISGGADSSYLTLKIKELGLRPLMVHVDAGWNYEVAVQNIERVIKYCRYDLYTHVMNWEDMKQLQLAYLKSGIANQDVPQDHAFFAALYHYAVKNKIKYVLTGGNIATEAIFPKSWHNDAIDSKNLKAIFKHFGNGKLKEYKTISYWQYYFYYPYIKRMKVIRPLNFMPYDKKEAMKKLQEKTGWRPYGRKHGESVFTRFFQNYYLVERYGFDKRKPHLSSMILSDQISRQEALEELSKPLYDKQQLREDKYYFQKKLSLSNEEFKQLIDAPLRNARDFPNNEFIYERFKAIQSFLERLSGKRIARYS